MAFPSGASQLTQPSYFRARDNGGAAAIPRGYIVTRLSAGGVALSAGASENLYGVSTETMSVGGPTSSVQVGGIAPVVAGGAFLPGDYITSDAQGRGIKATITGQRVIGQAEDASSGVGACAGVELKTGIYTAPPA